MVVEGPAEVEERADGAGVFEKEEKGVRGCEIRGMRRNIDCFATENIRKKRGKVMNCKYY